MASMNNQLSEFQITTEAALARHLADHDRRLVDRRVEYDLRDESTTIVTHIDGTDATVWLYEDGACLSANAQQRVFEALDFRTLEALRSALLAAVATAVTRPDLPSNER